MAHFARFLVVCALLICSWACAASQEHDFLATAIITETLFAVCECINSPLPLTPKPLLSTDLQFPGGGSITGVTVHVASSPTSCYSLPTPTSSLVAIALGISQIEDASAADPIYLYMGQNGTVPQYLGTTVNGQRALLEISNSTQQKNQTAIILSDGESLLFDEDGIQHFGAGCDSVTEVNIDNFWHQAAQLAAPTIPEPAPGGYPSLARVMERDTQQTFFAMITVDKGMDNGTVFNPTMRFGNTPCDFQGGSYSAVVDNYTWACQYPGNQSAVSRCKDAMGDLVGREDSTSGGGGSLDLLSPLMAKASSGVVAVMPGLSPALAEGIGFVARAQTVVRQAVSLVGSPACELLDLFDVKLLVVAGPSPLGTRTLGGYAYCPTYTVTGDYARTPRPPITKEPAREPAPGINLGQLFPATAFTPTTSFAGLTIFPGEATGNMPNIVPLSTSTSTGPTEISITDVSALMSSVASEFGTDTGLDLATPVRHVAASPWPSGAGNAPTLLLGHN